MTASPVTGRAIGRANFNAGREHHPCCGGRASPGPEVVALRQKWGVGFRSSHQRPQRVEVSHDPSTEGRRSRMGSRQIDQGQRGGRVCGDAEMSRAGP